MIKGNNGYLVGAYERLSREDDRMDESSSIESQRLIIESFAKFNGLRIVKHYSDDGYTGSNFERPGFEELKEDIEEGLINCVIVKDLSRLGRELYGTGSYIEEYFKLKQVRFIAINDGYDSDVGDEMLGLRLSVNDLYLRDTSKKIRSSFNAKRIKGDYIGSFPKYGYMKNPENPKQLIPDPQTAPIVRQMFEWAVEGAGTSTIAHRLTKAGYPIPSIYKKENRPMNQKELNSGNGIWRPQTVKDILESKMYLGHMVQGIWKKVSYNSKKLIVTPEKDWYIVENTHEPIITQEMYDKVQLVLEKAKIYAARKEKRFLLQGLLVCKDCGHNLTISQRKRKKGYSYSAECNYYTKYSKYGLCCSHRINYKDLEDDIINLLKKIGKGFYEDYDHDALLKESVNIKRKEIIGIEKKLKKIELDIKKNHDIINKLYEDRLNEVISSRQYAIMAKKYDESLEKLEKEKERTEKEYDKAKDNDEFSGYEECKRLLKQFVEFEKPTNELMYQLIEKIEVDKDKNIEVYFKVNVEKYLNLLA